MSVCLIKKKSRFSECAMKLQVSQLCLRCFVQDAAAEMVVMCCRFLCYFCRTSRQNQRAMFEHLSYMLDNSSMLLGEHIKPWMYQAWELSSDPLISDVF